MHALKLLSPEIKVISELGLESLKCRVLSSCLRPLGQRFVRYGPTRTRSCKTTLLQSNAECVDQLGHKLYHLWGDLGVHNYRGGERLIIFKTWMVQYELIVSKKATATVRILTKLIS